MDMNTEEAPPPLTIDEIDEEFTKPAELTPDQAAARSRSHEFNGHKLNPFTKTAQLSAESMGVICCSPSFGNHAEALAETGTYPGMFPDAVACLWLCQAPKTDVLRAVRKPDEANRKAWAWWEENGGDIGSPLYIEALGVLNEILEEIFAVTAETESNGGGGNSGLGES